MRKVYTIMICLLAGMSSVMAQKNNSIVFADANGNEYTDGATIYATTVEESPMGAEIASGVYLKNTTSAISRAEIKYNISTMDNGYHSICTQTLCNTDEATGSFTYPTIVGLRVGQSASLIAEWYPSAYGQASVTYTLTIYDYVNDNYVEVGDGYSITVNYVYADPAGIEGVAADGAVSTTYYSLTGRRVANPGTGMFLAKKVMADGSVKTVKVLKK